MSHSPVSKRGFTLIEMMIVLTIIALVVSAGIMKFGEPMRTASLESSHASVLTTIESARHKSVSGVGGVPHGVRIEENQIETFQSNATATPLTSLTLPSHLSLVDEDGEPAEAEMTFQRISGVVGGAGYVLYVRDSTTGESRKVTITEDGYVY